MSTIIAPLPAGPFQVISADPPWPYDNTVSGASAEDHYRTMSMEDLIGMGPMVWEAASADAALFMWVTGPFMPEAVRLIGAWGFRYVTVAFVWVKVGKTDVDLSATPPSREVVLMPERNGSPGGPRFPRYGRGNYTRPGCEYVLLGTRGSVAVPKSDVAQVLFSELPGGEHSSKPNEVAARIERMYPKASRLELFSRRERTGWTMWGDQAPEGAQC